ncbi:MAG: hypothetical protein ACFFC6_08255 [Promethearchaeota archaeon]
MKFKFDIGKEERHKIEFIYSRIWGRKSIKVDDQTVKTRIFPVFISLLILILASYYLFNMIIRYPQQPIFIFEIFLSMMILLILDAVIVKLPISVTVGEKEKYSVEIKWFWKPFPGWRSTTFKVYINGYFYKTFENERLVEYVDEQIVYS